MSSKKSKKSLKTLVIIRHAHRETLDRALDNGLSSKGREQVEALMTYFKRSSKASRTKESRAAWISSPKRRCKETLAPLAQLGGSQVAVIDLLAERGPDEMLHHFEHRIREFCEWWLEEGPELTFACSHGDWIPACVEQLTGARVQVSKGSWCEVVISAESEQPVLRWLIQRFA